jgi:hypothetical protein
MRRQAIGMDIFSDMWHSTLGLDIPTNILNAKTMRSLTRMLSDWAGLCNNLLSYRKEIEREGDFHNGVLIIQRFLDCSLQEAANIVNDLATVRLQQFEEIVATELPVFFEESELDTKTREEILKYVKALEDWTCGTAEWCIRAGRYFIGRDGYPKARDLIGSPKGLGTSATQIGSSSVLQETPEPNVQPIVQKLLPGPTGLGTSASEIGSTPVPQETTEPDVQLIVQNLLPSPTGLGTSASKIGSSSVPQETPQPDVQPIVHKLLANPTGLGTSAIQIIGSSSVPQEITEPALEPIVQNLLRGPTGLGTSGTQISSSAVPEETTESALEPMAQEVVSNLTKLGTTAMHIQSLLGTKG